MAAPLAASGVGAPAPARTPRDERLDALRGLGIILVVLGHAIVRGVDSATPATSGAVLLQGIGYVRLPFAFAALLNAIYSAHIPLLAFVSGFVLSSPKGGFGRRFVGRRFWGLFVPYVSWLAVNWAVGGEHTLPGFLRFMAGGVVSTQSAGALWYLYALFTSTLLLAGVMALGGSTRALLISAGFVGVLGILPLGGYDRILGLSDVAWLYPFVVAGVVVARHRERVDRLRWALPVSTLVWLASLPLVWQVLVAGDRWWYPGVAAVIAPLGAPLVPVALKALWAVIRLSGALAGVVAAYCAFAYVSGRARTALAWIGRRTLGLYATHGYFLLVGLAALAPPARVLAYFVLALAGGLAATLALERAALTRRFFLGIRQPL